MMTIKLRSYRADDAADVDFIISGETPEDIALIRTMKARAIQMLVNEGTGPNEATLIFRTKKGK